MHISFVILIVAFCGNVKSSLAIGIVPQSVEAYNSVTDYYWRDYQGLVPSDAIVGGVDLDGIKTYIGQFSVEAQYGQQKSKIHLLPATIRIGVVGAYAPYYGRVVYANHTDNVKVLCGPYASRFWWYSMTEVFPPKCRFVVTGNEDLSPMYTGQATVDKEKITGKIFSDTLNHRPGLTIPLANGQVNSPTDYLVLTYCN
ncbi:hypothetical protein FQR65_LT08648 [Abscondita terminalis]|nr:hypothetical protein FQR65_LT08648 [Abscondita terminalis]